MNMGPRHVIQIFLAATGAFLTSFQPALAQGADTAQATPPLQVKEDTRPPVGYARPPLYVRPQASSKPPAGAFTASGIRTFYGIPADGGDGVTIGIVDAYDNPNAKPDLDTFSSVMGLPVMQPCGTSSGKPVLTGGCFAKVPGSGARLPRGDQGWALEISLDVQWAHAVAPKGNILLVEAASNSFTDLLAAVDKAVSLGATVVSMSWGGKEFSSESGYDAHFCSPAHPVTFFASSGDSGFGAEYPSASPCVVSVGGTTATLGAGGAYGSETAWSGSGGGVSSYEAMPASQQNYPIGSNWSGGNRATPDVAYVGDPNTGFAVYDSYGYQGQKGWFQVGGTSAGAPQWAALFAIADSGRSSSLTGLSSVYLAASYNYSNNYHDVTSGSNGTCGTNCNATTGYDVVTGLGSPQATPLTTFLHGLTQ